MSGFSNLVLRKLELKNPKLSLLESCTTLSHLKIIHAHLIRAHTIFDVFAASCLISISIDKNLLDYAAQVFYQIQNPNLFIYNSFIRGFSGSKDPDKSFHFYVQSKRNGLVPDNLTYPFLVKACTQKGSLDMGIQAHGQIIRHGFDNDVYVQNSLVTMYSTLGDIKSASYVFRRISCLDVVSWTSMVAGYIKSGDVTSARKLFDKMPEKNLVTWSVMISGYAKNSFFDKAIELYFLLQSEGVHANETVMVSVIASCAHLGALELGERAHDYILRNKMTVNLILGTALVDMYARCGSIDKAIWVFDQLPGRDALSWTALIAGFAMHGYAEKALDHPEIQQIERMWEEILGKIRLAGYTGNNDDALFDIDEEEKESNIHRHSEKLAIAYAIMRTKGHDPIRIVKNLRVCEDCHTATKLISKVYERELIVRDRNRFHHFKGGACSCMDYW
ncbi:hypothetical protein Peur_033495 [Populus x canadensis]